MTYLQQFALVTLPIANDTNLRDVAVSLLLLCNDNSVLSVATRMLLGMPHLVPAMQGGRSWQCRGG